MALALVEEGELGPRGLLSMSKGGVPSGRFSRIIVPCSQLTDLPPRPARASS